MPSSGDSDKSGQVCHTIFLPHQGVLAPASIFNISILFHKNHTEICLFKADSLEI